MDYPKVKVCLDTSEDNLIDELYFVIEDSEENDNNADADRAEWLTDLSQTRRCEHEK